ncbi:hypothetical protein [Sedimentibacter sp.]|uniref:hypothetical protein n=1 Tax=Sedimentibacter sp. TaxID=1960295 RepID=UPI00289C83E0|nr:hypothetical protein [Sedimentibacter sp.]
MLDNNISIKTNNPVNDNHLNKPKIKTEEVQPFNVIDPTKVIKPQKQDASNQTGQNLYNYNPDSVFEKFIKSLHNSPVFAESARKLILNRQFINSNIKNDPVLGTLFKSFLESIEMNDGEILEFLKFQHGTYTKFNGEFFDALRNLLSKTNANNDDFKTAVKNFLRSYDCFVSLNETNKSIESALTNIERNLPQMLKESFNELTGKLLLDNGNSMEMNLNILKNEILPFMGRYISKMNDFGAVKDYVSLLIHNMVRMETASKENFADSMETLFEYIKYNFDFSEKDIEDLRLSLLNTYETSSSIKNNSVDSFLKLIKSGVTESENLVSKGMMEEMTESLLFSQNVHLPLMHMFLPVNYNGMFMFSELWIGKSYEESSDKKKKQEYVQTYKVFVTFDIQNIGYFETTLVLKESKLSLDIYVPNNLSGSIGKIREDLISILDKNNLSVSNISVQESVRKRRFNEVFSNFIERKIGVDVTI